MARELVYTLVECCEFGHFFLNDDNVLSVQLQSLEVIRVYRSTSVNLTCTPAQAIPSAAVCNAILHRVQPLWKYNIEQR